MQEHAVTRDVFDLAMIRCYRQFKICSEIIFLPETMGENTGKIVRVIRLNVRKIND